MQSLSERQKLVFSLIVQEYTRSPTPVSSGALVENYPLGVSSATVRNDMAVLEERGFLIQPHTSAGRIPTEVGYRYFVARLIGEDELSRSERQTINHQFHQARVDLDQWMRLAASVLAEVSQSASLVTSPQFTQNRYKHIALISTQDRLVLMVLVLDGGQVYQRMVTLTEPVEQAMLDRAANQLNALCENLTAEEILERASRLDVLEREISEYAIDVVQQADTHHKSVVREGLTNILDESDHRNEGIRQTLRMLEEHDTLEQVLSGILTPDVKGVQVLIAGEGRWDELSHCSIIVARYGEQGRSSGALGVVGPTRMDYSRGVSVVQFISQLMTDMLRNVYSPASDQNSS